MALSRKGVDDFTLEEALAAIGQGFDGAQLSLWLDQSSGEPRWRVEVLVEAGRLWTRQTQRCSEDPARDLRLLIATIAASMSIARA